MGWGEHSPHPDPLRLLKHEYNNLWTTLLQPCGIHHDNICLYLLLSVLFCIFLPSSIFSSVSTTAFYLFFSLASSWCGLLAELYWVQSVKVLGSTWQNSCWDQNRDKGFCLWFTSECSSMCCWLCRGCSQHLYRLPSVSLDGQQLNSVSNREKEGTGSQAGGRGCWMQDAHRFSLMSICSSQHSIKIASYLPAQPEKLLIISGTWV